jgi:hypothetical protein
MKIGVFGIEMDVFDKKMGFLCETLGYIVFVFI